MESPVTPQKKPRIQLQTMPKRGNDNSQLSKEELAAQEAHGDTEEARIGITRASNEQLAGRRIIKRARRPEGSSAAGGSSSNPFASVSLSNTSSKSAAGDGLSIASFASAPAPVVNATFTFATKSASGTPTPDTPLVKQEESSDSEIQAILDEYRRGTISLEENMRVAALCRKLRPPKSVKTSPSVVTNTVVVAPSNVAPAPAASSGPTATVPDAVPTATAPADYTIVVKYARARLFTMEGGTKKLVAKEALILRQFPSKAYNLYMRDENSLHPRLNLNVAKGMSYSLAPYVHKKTKTERQQVNLTGVNYLAEGDSEAKTHSLDLPKDESEDLMKQLESIGLKNLAKAP